MKLNIIKITTHSCYILKSSISNRIYIGYTTDFRKRLRQHNGEIKGGAKKTKNWRPWHPICLIKGFEESNSALRFEYRLQHYKKRNLKQNAIIYVINNLKHLIKSGDGSFFKNNKKDWPELVIHWYQNYSIDLNNVLNEYEH